MVKAIYKGKRIDNIPDLSFLLKIPAKKIIETAENSDSFYSENPQPKKGGGTRMTYRVEEPLKEIQQRIYETIFQQIDYPKYLMGSIKDKDYPRDYIRDAKLHCGSDWILVEDIKNFFPSITKELVFRIFRDLLKFPFEISTLLTKLTTYKGFVPQGASTSSVIANLILWKEEPIFFNMVTRMGFIYSRYVDDITISYLGKPDSETIKKITSTLYSMLFYLELKPNRKKRKIMNKGGQLYVHNLVINSGYPKVSRAEISRIRTAVFQLETKVQKNSSFKEISQEFRSVEGRVQRLKILNQNEYWDLANRLKRIRALA